MNMVELAKELAFKWHKEQTYGDEPYVKHTERVALLVEQHAPTKPEVIAAAWCHDLLEDTEITSFELIKTLGQYVYELVDKVTDKEGKNRLHRQLNTYHHTRKDPDAVTVKLADRIVNEKKSLRENSKQRKMYKEEYFRFKFALYSGNKRHDELWEILDELYERL